MDGGVPWSNTVPLGRPLAQLNQTAQPMRMARVPLPGRPPAPQHKHNGRVAAPRRRDALLHPVGDLNTQPTFCPSQHRVSRYDASATTGPRDN